jgi:hypothetical protein
VFATFSPGDNSIHIFFLNVFVQAESSLWSDIHIHIMTHMSFYIFKIFFNMLNTFSSCAYSRIRSDITHPKNWVFWTKYQTFLTVIKTTLRWCSGYHICFTRRRSRVRSSLEVLFLNIIRKINSLIRALYIVNWKFAVFLVKDCLFCFWLLIKIGF